MAARSREQRAALHCSYHRTGRGVRFLNAWRRAGGPNRDPDLYMNLSLRMKGVTHTGPLHPGVPGDLWTWNDASGERVHFKAMVRK